MPQVQMQAVQELWDMLSVDSDLDVETEYVDAEPQLHMLLSSEAVSAETSPKTFKFQGVLQGHSVMILVDPGSSHSFVTTKLGYSLSSISVVSRPIQVQVANGQVIQCTSKLSRRVGPFRM
jgi:hypothetical protein